MAVDLFKPYRIGRLELRNRFIRSATHDCTADSSGAVTDASVARYHELAEAEIGLIVTGFSYVSPLGQAMTGQYGAHTDDMIPGLRRLVEVVHHRGAKIALQIVHAGINSEYLPRVGISSLAVSKRQDMSIPHQEMTHEEIEHIISDFGCAAARAREAGFDAVQLHGAHGYLMSQFLSPLFNLRTDRWGGSAENRRRFHLELIQRVRRTIGADFPLLVKFGVQDDVDGGLAFREGLVTALGMVEGGVDALEISAGIRKGPPIAKKGDPERTYYRERASAVKREVSVPVILVGGIRSLETAQDIVDSGDADLISMSRPLIREPGLISRWQRGDTRSAKCISCLNCQPFKDKPIQCAQELRVHKRQTPSPSPDL